MAMSDLILRGGTSRPMVFVPFETPETGDQPTPETEIDLAAQIASVRAKAEAEGFHSGYERGYQAGENGLRGQSERLKQILDGAAHDLEVALLVLEPQVVELALIVAGRLVDREFAEHRELVGEIVRAALIAASGTKIFRVRVNPDDHAFLVEMWPALTPPLTGIVVEPVSDQTIQRGGCVIDTATGLVDAQPDVRLDELRRQILPLVGVVP